MPSQTSPRTSTRTRSARRRWAFAAFLAVAALLIPSMATSAMAADAPTLQNGDQVFIGSRTEGYGGTELQSVYSPIPSDPATQADPEFWTYCVEHDVHRASSKSTGIIGGFDSYLGDNLFTQPAVQAKVLWVIEHSYPAMSLADFGTASGVPGISQNDAIEATQYAIWRYTDLGYDADWNWETDDSENAYEYLVNGANDDEATTPAVVAPTVSVTAPPGMQVAGMLVGPFVVHTNQPTAAITVGAAFAVVDANGDPVDAAAVVDGQQFYLDLSDATAAGNTTVTASVSGSTSTGKVVTLPSDTGQTPTAADHGQSVILVTPSTSTTSAQAAVEWGTRVTPPVPSIGTTLVDSSDGDHTLAWDGGTLTDTVTYQGLTPGTEYTLSGTLMKKSDGTSTGLTGSATFTPTEASGSVNVLFVVPDGYAGEDLVAFESLIVDGGLLATHEDIDDAPQTVSVDSKPTTPLAPSIGTTLVDSSDGDHALASTGGTLTDAVAYQNLTPGTEYTVSGELMKKSDGSATGIKGTKNFTPTEANGTVEVTFTVPDSYAGEDLVAFESVTLADSDDVLASHADINSVDQTVAVDDADSTPTDTPTTDTPTTPAGNPTTDAPTTPASNSTTGTSTVPASASTSAAAAPVDDSGSAGGGLVRTGGTVSLVGAGMLVLVALGLGAGALALSRRRGTHR